MKCPTCDASIPDDAAFCLKCGTKVGAAAASAAVAPNANTAPGSPGVSAPGKNLAQAGTRRGGRDVPEEEIWSGGYSPKAMYGIWIGAAVATVGGLVAVIALRNDSLGWLIWGVGLVVLWGGLFAMLGYRRLSVKYRLTNQRLFHEQGILRRVTDRIEVIDIDDVTFEQGIVERMLGVGTIRVTSSDRTSPELMMPGIDDVKLVADQIDQARRAERHRRGLFIESV